MRIVNSITNRMSGIQAAFFLHCLAIIVILLVRDVTGIYISKWLILAACIMPYMIFDLNSAMAFTIFLLPFSEGLPFNYICLFSVIILIAKYINKIALNSYILVMVLIFIVELSSVFYGRFSLADYIRFTGPFLLISLLIYKSDDEEISYVTMLGYFLFGAIGSELSIILQTINTLGIDTILAAGIRLGETSGINSNQGMRLSYNPNVLGRICAYSIGASLVLLNRSKFPKAVLMIIMVSQMIVGSLTLSRYFLLLIAVIVLFYLASLAQSVNQFFKGLAVLCIVAVGIYFSASYFTPNVVEGYLARGVTQEDLSNGRLEIGNEYFESVIQNPERLFFGVGLQNYEEKVGMYVSCHNGVQEVLITWGVTGLILVALYIWGLYRHGWRGVPQYKRKIIYLLPLIVFVIGIQSGQFFSTYTHLWLLLPYATMRLAKDNDGQIVN